jgi:hypothetical protein
MYGLSGVWEFYLLADIPFEIILAVSGSLSVLWLYQPLYRVVSQLERSTSLRPQKSRT